MDTFYINGVLIKEKKKESEILKTTIGTLKRKALDDPDPNKRKVGEYIANSYSAYKAKLTNKVQYGTGEIKVELEGEELDAAVNEAYTSLVRNNGKFIKSGHPSKADIIANDLYIQNYPQTQTKAEKEKAKKQ